MFLISTQNNPWKLLTVKLLTVKSLNEELTVRKVAAHTDNPTIEMWLATAILMAAPACSCYGPLRVLQNYGLELSRDFSKASRSIEPFCKRFRTIALNKNTKLLFCQGGLEGRGFWDI